MSLSRTHNEAPTPPAGQAGTLWPAARFCCNHARYDALNRLTHTETVEAHWGQTYTFDGFGNLTAKTVTKGSGTNWTNAVDPATNRMAPGAMVQSYDANGNAYFGSGQYGGSTYDVENRMNSHSVWYPSTPHYEGYQYDPNGKRVALWTWNSDGTTNTNIAVQVYTYDIKGQRSGTAQYHFDNATGNLIQDSGHGEAYFLGRPVARVTDRLGTVRATAAGTTMTYLPYGEELTSTADGQYKFGTYLRDSTLNNQDYADQRYYHAALGRFYTADPVSGDPADPESWNKYMYTHGDPVNRSDPHGTDDCVSWEFDASQPGNPCMDQFGNIDIPGCGVFQADLFNPGIAMGCLETGITMYPPPILQPTAPAPPGPTCGAPPVLGQLTTLLGPGSSGGCLPGSSGEYQFDTSVSAWNQLAAGSSLLPQLAGAGGAGTIIIGGQTISWEVVIGALGAPEVVLTVAGVAAVALLYQALTRGGQSADCAKEWSEATNLCSQLLGQRNAPRGITGGYTSVYDCAKGLVSERCGGNPIDWGRKRK